MGADLVAVEHLDAAAARAQLRGKPFRNRAFARAGQTGEPHGESLVQLEFLSGRLDCGGTHHLNRGNFKEDDPWMSGLFAPSASIPGLGAL